MTKIRPPEVYDAHRRYHDEREKMAAVARACGMTRSGLRYAFRRYGLPLRGRRGPRLVLSADEMADAMRLHEAGQSWEDVARVYAMSRPTLVNQMRAAGYATDTQPGGKP